MELLPCRQCHRHLSASEVACPFCGVEHPQRAPMAEPTRRGRVGRVAALAMASAVGASACPVYGAPCPDDVPDPPPGTVQLEVCPGFEAYEPLVSGGCVLRLCQMSSAEGCDEWRVDQVGEDPDCTIFVDLGDGQSWTGTGRWQETGCGESPDTWTGIESIGEEPVSVNEKISRCPSFL